VTTHWQVLRFDTPFIPLYPITIHGSSNLQTAGPYGFLSFSQGPGPTLRGDEWVVMV
jgi:hypothetical protein